MKLLLSNRHLKWSPRGVLSVTLLFLASAVMHGCLSANTGPVCDSVRTNWQSLQTAQPTGQPAEQASLYVHLGWTSVQQYADRVADRVEADLGGLGIFPFQIGITPRHVTLVTTAAGTMIGAELFVEERSLTQAAGAFGGLVSAPSCTIQVQGVLAIQGAEAGAVVGSSAGSGSRLAVSLASAEVQRVACSGGTGQALLGSLAAGAVNVLEREARARVNSVLAGLTLFSIDGTAFSELGYTLHLATLTARDTGLVVGVGVGGHSLAAPDFAMSDWPGKEEITIWIPEAALAPVLNKYLLKDGRTYEPDGNAGDSLGVRLASTAISEERIRATMEVFRLRRPCVQALFQSDFVIAAPSGTELSVRVLANELLESTSSAWVVQAGTPRLSSLSDAFTRATTQLTQGVQRLVGSALGSQVFWSEPVLAPGWVGWTLSTTN